MRSEKLTRVTFLHTNDEHSRLTPLVGKPEIGGIIARKHVVDAIRRETATTFLLSGGDYAQGLPVYDVWQGSAEVMAMNALGYDAITLGNHQFDLGVASLGRSLFGGALHVLGEKRRVPRAIMPVVVSNIEVVSEPALRDVVVPRTILERGGVRVGVVGAITEDLEKMVELPATLQMKPTVKSIQEQIDTLTQAGIDKIVLLSHRGTQKDLELVSKLTGIDIVVSAHDHAFLGDSEKLTQAGLDPHEASKAKQPYPLVTKNKDNGTTLIVSAGQWGQLLGRLNVDFDTHGNVVSWSGEPIVVRCDATRGCEGDASLELALSEYMKPVKTVTERVLNHFPRAMPVIADGESEIGMRMADAMLRATHAFGATLAIAQGDFRSGLPAGDVTYGDAYAAWPFDTRIVVVDLTSDELTQVVEKWLQSDSAPPQVAGMQIAYTLNIGVPTKVDEITVLGTKIVATKHYKIAFDAYVARFGGYPTLTQACATATRCIDTHLIQRDVFIDELTRGPTTATPRLLRH